MTKAIEIANKEIPEKVGDFFGAIMIALMIILGLSADSLSEYYPTGYMTAAAIVAAALYMIMIAVNKAIMIKKEKELHRKQRILPANIFRGVTETSPLVEDIINSRIDNAVLTAINAGANSRSLIRDLERIEWIASTLSMRNVEVHLNDVLMHLRIEMFS